MYAIVKCGGQQVKVAAGDKITVEKLEIAVGGTVKLDNVMLVASGASITVGTPLIAGASVTAEVLEQKRGEKILVFKKRRRQNYRRRQGHRQSLTVLKITAINAK
jgi:large subunit ribosomal protein L21